MSRRAGPRIRTMKPELWQDERFAAVGLEARLLYIGLVSQADDEGRQSANLALLRSRIYPFDVDLPPEALGDWLVELARAGLIVRYEGDGGRSYVAVVSWHEDQRIDKPTASDLPKPPDETPRTRETAAIPRDESRGIAITPTGPDRDRDRDREPTGDPRAGAAGPAPDVRTIFDTWVTATERDPTRTKLTADRRRRIEKALSTHGLDDCLAAVTHIGADSWARGQNDRGRRFDDIEHALGNAERTERWRDQRPRVNGNGHATTYSGDLSRFDHAGAR